MRDEEDRRAVIWRRREWRQRWIAKFAARQRIARRWIALVDLVDWCAQSTTTASLDAETKAREVAYQRITDALRRGEFERDGQSKILYLDALVTSDSLSPSCRLTREQFEFVFGPTATRAPSSLPVTMLNCCWLPCELARHWLESHGYRWAPHFEPAPIPTDDRKSPKALRAKPRPPSREKEFWSAARQIAVEWLVDNGCPIPGDGNQAELERHVTGWLEGHGHEASEAAVRRHVARWINERRAELNA